MVSVVGPLRWTTSRRQFVVARNVVLKVRTKDVKPVLVEISISAEQSPRKQLHSVVMTPTATRFRLKGRLTVRIFVLPVPILTDVRPDMALTAEVHDAQFVWPWHWHASWLHDHPVHTPLSMLHVCGQQERSPFNSTQFQVKPPGEAGQLHCPATDTNDSVKAIAALIACMGEAATEISERSGQGW